MSIAGLYVTIYGRVALLRARAGRAEYWFFTIANCVAWVVLWRVDLALGLASVEWHVGLLSGVLTLLVLPPQISVTVRRLHDTGHSGRWILVPVVPFVGSFWLLSLMMMPGQPGANVYGGNPVSGKESG
jgi:uncharacterized membrane protein YhaH (DUF805 family)